MAKKFYAVRVGRKPGVYTNWADCEIQVKQYPGAIFKGFADEDAAWEFIDGVECGGDVVCDGVVAYVDGSFDVETFTYAYGVVILNNGRETHLSDVGSDLEMAKMRNVAGEIMGAMAAMEYAKDNGIEEILIIHDYEGIGAWPTKRWKANLNGTREYVEKYEEISESVKIKFQKCTGHSGNFYNDVADALAKKELGVKIKKSIEDYILAVAETD
jgi:ribonuclease HI